MYNLIWQISRLRRRTPVVPHEHFERAVRSAKVLPQGLDIRRDLHLHQEPGIIAGRDHVAEYFAAAPISAAINRSKIRNRRKSPLNSARSLEVWRILRSLADLDI